jgi:hypothetical protein
MSARQGYEQARSGLGTGSASTGLPGPAAEWSHLGDMKLKQKLSNYTPRRRLGEKEIQLLLILGLGTR